VIYQQLALPHPIAQVAGPASQGIAYGGMRKTLDQAFGTVGATFMPVTSYTVNVFDPPSGVTTDIFAGSLHIDEKGLYNLVINLVMSFTPDNNSSRIMHFRIFDITDNIPVPNTDTTMHVGGYSGGISQSFSVALSVTDALVGKHLRVEIGGGDTFAAVLLTAALFSVTSIGAVG